MAPDKEKKAIAGVDNTQRRTWDKDEYAAKAADREAKVFLHQKYC